MPETSHYVKNVAGSIFLELFRQLYCGGVGTLDDADGDQISTVAIRFLTVSEQHKRNRPRSK